MTITEEMKKDLAKLIVANLQREFETIHFTGNLANTITISEINGGIAVEIPAQRYSFAAYQKKGIIIPYEKGGSYASEVDKTGGFSGTHKGYVEKSISMAIAQWMKMYRINGRVK